MAIGHLVKQVDAKRARTLCRVCRMRHVQENGLCRSCGREHGDQRTNFERDRDLVAAQKSDLPVVVVPVVESNRRIVVSEGVVYEVVWDGTGRV